MNKASEIAPPKGRLIWITANIVHSDGCFTDVEPFSGKARWSDRFSGEWVDEHGLSIRSYDSSELIVLEWEELDRSFLLLRLSGKRWQEKETPVSMIRALKPLPLALPAPTWLSNLHDPAHRDLYRLTDRELEERLELQDQFMRYLLDGRGTREELWYHYGEAASKIETLLEEDAGRRWLRARRKARTNAAENRRKKKAKATV